MSADLPLQHFRGVLCRHCSKPVRVPGIVLRKDSECQGVHDANDVHFHLISRVFVLRCRSCERESVYTVNQIIDCDFTAAHDPGSVKHAVV